MAIQAIAKQKIKTFGKLVSAVLPEVDIDGLNPQDGNEQKDSACLLKVI